MAASTNTEAKDLAIWVDGFPAANIQTSPSVSTGDLQFWVDGLPYAPVYPSTSTNGVSFMQFFWGI